MSRAMPPFSIAPTRRGVIAGAGAVFSWAQLRRAARAATRDPRFVVIVLRGALDGLAIVAPVGDPHWRELRGADALTLDGEKPGLRLDNGFALHPAMPSLYEFYRHGHATIVHAVASPYRDRSHFDGQDVLQTGATKPGALDTGWLNRAVTALAPQRAGSPHAGDGLAIGPVTPLIMRGPAPVLSWEAQKLPPASNETTLRLIELYRHTDPMFARVLEERIGMAAITQSGGTGPATAAAKGDAAVQPGGIAAVRGYFVEAAGAAAKFLARPDGPRVGALAFDGWDTHVNEGPVNGRLAVLLGALDDALAAFAGNMGEAWHETALVVITEFGRTAHINGNGGTDHGTATIAVLAGGALNGGRMIADWPGLANRDLYEARDLKPTTDLRAVVKGLLHDHLGIGMAALTTTVFPDSAAVRPIPDLVA
jgi:uncharacterized protein (DUF1501 family)